MILTKATAIIAITIIILLFNWVTEILIGFLKLTCSVFIRTYVSQIKCFIFVHCITKTLIRIFAFSRSTAMTEDTSVNQRYSVQGEYLFFYYYNLHCNSLYIRRFSVFFRSFPLSISTVKVTKSTIFCGFVHIYWGNP